MHLHVVVGVLGNSLMVRASHFRRVGSFSIHGLRVEEEYSSWPLLALACSTDVLRAFIVLYAGDIRHVLAVSHDLSA